jgi:hypothetical protein
LIYSDGSVLNGISVIQKSVCESSIQCQWMSNMWLTNYKSVNYSLLTCLNKKEQRPRSQPHAHGLSLSHASNDVDETTSSVSNESESAVHLYHNSTAFFLQPASLTPNRPCSWIDADHLQSGPRNIDFDWHTPICLVYRSSEGCISRSIWLCSVPLS